MVNENRHAGLRMVSSVCARLDAVIFITDEVTRSVKLPKNEIWPTTRAQFVYKYFLIRVNQLVSIVRRRRTIESIISIRVELKWYNKKVGHRGNSFAHTKRGSHYAGNFPTRSTRHPPSPRRSLHPEKRNEGEKNSSRTLPLHIWEGVRGGTAATLHTRRTADYEAVRGRGEERRRGICYVQEAGL